MCSFALKYIISTQHNMLYSTLMCWHVVILFFCDVTQYHTIYINDLHDSHDILAPPLRHILITRNNQPPPPPPSYTTRGICSYRKCLLPQQRLLLLMGPDYLITATIENFPDRPQILTLEELLERNWIFEGVLRSVVSSRRNHLFVGGLTPLHFQELITHILR